MKDETKDETKRVSLPWESGATSTPADARGGTGDRTFDDAQKTGEVARLREELAAKDQQRAMMEADLIALRAQQATESDVTLRHQHKLSEMTLDAQLREHAGEREALRDDLRRAEERKAEAQQRLEERREEAQRKAQERERIEAQAKEEQERVEAQRAQIAIIAAQTERLRLQQIEEATSIFTKTFVATASAGAGVLLWRWLRSQGEA